MQLAESLAYQRVVDDICGLNWAGATPKDMMHAAWGYYYFSIQFRENLRIARALYPDDAKLVELEQEECDTANLSPWPGVAMDGEKMNHDEFMRRTLQLTPIPVDKALVFEVIGNSYLERVRKMDHAARAASIASYEDGGLEAVFGAMLRFRNWDNALLRAYQHFLVQHVRFDSDPEHGHGALSRHIPVTDDVLPLWIAFRDVLLACAPALGRT
jgi:hypothetical protein